MKVEWHPLARQDLLEAVAYIAEDNPDAAYRVYDAIEQCARLLATMPEMGRPGRCKGTRELVIPGTPHIAAYRVHRRAVAVLA